MKVTFKHILILALAISLAAPTLILAQCGSSKGCGLPCGSANDVKKAAHPDDCGCAQCSKMKNASVDVAVEKEGNVWVTEDGTKYFTCPVMNEEGRVENAESFSVIKGVKYYHCCSACQAPFRAETAKWLKDFTLPGNVYMVDKDGQKRFRDPVNGDAGVVDKNTKSFDMDGYRYYFTSKKSVKTFKNSPQNYLTHKSS
ncbi:hypothetical protein K9N50_07335 [bacterium]|nr:hypothetical protein [bacterium]